MNKQFYEDLNKVMTGEMKPERIINKIEKVVGALVDNLYKQGKITLDGTTLKTLCDMGTYLESYDEVYESDHLMIRAQLYALVKTAIETN